MMPVRFVVFFSLKQRWNWNSYPFFWRTRFQKKKTKLNRCYAFSAVRFSVEQIFPLIIKKKSESGVFFFINCKHIVFVIKFSDVYLFAILGQHGWWCCNQGMLLSSSSADWFNISFGYINKWKKNRILWNETKRQRKRKRDEYFRFVCQLKNVLNLSNRICLWWTETDTLSSWHTSILYVYVRFTINRCL